MKRWTLTILLFLLIGAIVNIAVAWGCATFSDRDNSSYWETAYWEGDWPIPGYFWRLHRKEYPNSTDGVQIQQDRFALIDFGVETFAVRSHFRSTDKGQRYCTVATTTSCVGWPFRSMWAHGHVVDYVAGDERAGRHSWQRGFGLDVRIKDLRYPPCLPRWPGFAINTLFYATILWLLFPGPFVIRRHVRVKRGRCPKCGYDLRGKHDAGCPECGWNRQPEATA